MFGLCKKKCVFLVSYLMYGCFLGQKIVEDKAKKKRLRCSHRGMMEGVKPYVRRGKNKKIS